MKVASLTQAMSYCAKLNFLQSLVLHVWLLSFLRSVKEMQEPEQHNIVIGYGPNELGFASLEKNIKTGC